MKYDRKMWQYIFVQSLTLGRIPLILIFLAVCLFTRGQASPLWFVVAFTAMILSAVTDLFDGYFARKFKVTSRLGAYADPLTDKIFYLTTFPSIVFLAMMQGDSMLLMARLLLGLTIIFLMRDQYISFLRSIGALHHIDAKANWSGKARTIISFPAICAIYYYLQAPESWWLQVSTWVVYVLIGAQLIINTVSIWVYTSYYMPVLRKEMRLPGGDS